MGIPPAEKHSAAKRDMMMTPFVKAAKGKVKLAFDMNRHAALLLRSNISQLGSWRR